MDELKKSLKDFLRIKNYSEHTISNYERDVNRFLKYLSWESNIMYYQTNTNKNYASKSVRVVWILLISLSLISLSLCFFRCSLFNTSL